MSRGGYSRGGGRPWRPSKTPYTRGPEGANENTSFSFERGPSAPRHILTADNVSIRLPSGQVVRPSAPAPAVRPPPTDALPEGYAGGEFERWQRVTDTAPQRWSTREEIEIYQALKTCKLDRAGERPRVAICVTPDPIRPAFETLKLFLERFPELATFDIVFKPVNTLDIQIRSVTQNPDDERVLAALEVKTVSDYQGAQGSRTWNEDPPCHINTGRLAAQRERADLLKCPVIWVIKNVNSPWDVPVGVLRSLFKLRYLNERQSWLPAPNDAYVVLIAVHMLALAMERDSLQHAPAALVDLANRSVIALEPTRWIGTVFPGITPESAAGLQEAFPTPRQLFTAYVTAAPEKWETLIADISACSTQRAEKLRSEGKRVPTYGVARARGVAHFLGFVPPVTV